MKVKLIDSISGSSRKGRTVASAVGIAEDRWPLGAWVEQPDKKLEQEHRRMEQGMGKTQELLVLSGQR